MRLLIGMTILVCGCQILPQKEILCAVDSRCEPVVPTAFVLGKPDDKSNSHTTSLFTPVGIAVSSSGALFVADGGRRRVLAWNSFPTRNNQPADFAISADNHSVETPGGNFFVCRELPVPLQVSLSGNRLIATNDPFASPNNYAYFYNPPPTKFDYCSNYFAVMSMAASGKTFVRGGPLIAGGRFFLLDQGYNRLLIWDAVPTSNTITDANGVFGQMDFTSSAANRGGTPGNNTLSSPAGVPASNGTRLAVADMGNHRVLLWDALPTGTASVANVVLGQDLFTQNMPNRGQANANAATLNAPQAVAMASNQVAVADSGNNRVLIWNQIPSSSGKNADVVLGQVDFSGQGNSAQNVSGSTMNEPRGIATDGTRLVVSDSKNNRILLWNAWPTRNGQEADLILGQPTPSGSAMGGYVPTDTYLVAPVAVTRAGKQYFVVDREPSRVLMYAAPPTSPLDRPALVLGQPNLFSGQVNSDGVSAASLNKPQSASSDGTILAVADTDNNRILIWTSLPTRDKQPADRILGQDSDSSTAANVGGLESGLNHPRGVHVAGGKIYVADTDNHRVLIWNSIPTKNYAMADVVLGQASKSAGSRYRGGTGPSAATLNAPAAVATDGNAIYVSDTGSNRVLVYNTLAPADGQAATVVLGQTSLDGDMAAVVSDKALNAPIGLSLSKAKLYVADTGYHRVVSYDLASLEIGARATAVIGQSRLGTGDPNPGGLSLSGFYSPTGILISESGMYIADRDNGRILALPPQS